VDEFTLTSKLGPSDALKILVPHWDSWATLADFQRIAAAGFNLLRIPIGYWAFAKFDNDPYVSGAAPYLEAAIGWARVTGLKVWIDLHGAPGSQNGLYNSGQMLDALGWTTGQTVNQTLQVLQIISEKYFQPGYQDRVAGIELLNEPQIADLNFDTVKQFERDGFNIVRATSNVPVVLQDGFAPVKSWNGVLSPSDNNSQQGEFCFLFSVIGNP